MARKKPSKPSGNCRVSTDGLSAPGSRSASRPIGWRESTRRDIASWSPTRKPRRAFSRKRRPNERTAHVVSKSEPGNRRGRGARRESCTSGRIEPRRGQFGRAVEEVAVQGQADGRRRSAAGSARQGTLLAGPDRRQIRRKCEEGLASLRGGP